jgi:preprotein translocase subunit SecG
MFFMSTISSVIPYIQIVISVLLILAILLQHTGAQNGGALGGGDNMSSAFHTRRGLEKVLFIATIVLGVLFAVTSFLSLIR